MATDESNGHTEDRSQPLFVTTHWPVVLAAGHGDTTRADDALTHLCKTYWCPLYALAYSSTAISRNPNILRVLLLPYKRGCDFFPLQKRQPRRRHTVSSR
jgi:hypothetical protein